jgi:hypothetical protein
LTGDSFLFRYQFHAGQAERRAGVGVIVLFAKGMQSRKKFIDGKGCCKHVDADNCGPVSDAAGNVAIVDLLRVRGGVIAPKTGGCHVSHRKQATAQAAVRRIESSPCFEKQFGRPQDTVITIDHALGQVLPLARRMTRPTTLSMTDRNGIDHECVAEAFKTRWNVFILLYPIRALTRSTIVLPGNVKPAAGSPDGMR